MLALLLSFYLLTGQDWQKTAECKTEWKSAAIHTAGGGSPSDAKGARNLTPQSQEESQGEPERIDR